MTRPKFAPWLRAIAPTEREIRLSAPALETLAVVAYRQPVLRAEVEAIRGVACGEILRQLMDRDLLRIVGRSEELGRPLRYGTTKRFLEVFGLTNLDKLPLWSQLVRATPAATSDEALAESSSLPSESVTESVGGVDDA
jgi:segregation and condensation protein B